MIRLRSSAEDSGDDNAVDVDVVDVELMALAMATATAMEENRIELRIQQSRPQCMMATTTTTTDSQEPSSSGESESFSRKLRGEVELASSKPLCSIYPLPPCGSLFSFASPPLVLECLPSRSSSSPSLVVRFLASRLDPAREAVAVFKLQVWPARVSQRVYPCENSSLVGRAEATAGSGGQSSESCLLLEMAFWAQVCLRFH